MCLFYYSNLFVVMFFDISIGGFGWWRFFKLNNCSIVNSNLRVWIKDIFVKLVGDQKSVHDYEILCVNLLQHYFCTDALGKRLYAIYNQRS